MAKERKGWYGDEMSRNMHGSEGQAQAWMNGKGKRKGGSQEKGRMNIKRKMKMNQEG